jgi:hypothetical protein
MQRPQRLPQSPVKAYDLGFKNGASHGYDELRQGALDWLQAKYITDPDRPDRDSPEAKYLLDLVRQFQLHISELKMKRIP